MIDPPAPGRKRLVTVEFAVDVEGDDIHVINHNQMHDSTWAEAYRGMLEIQKDIDRQIEERFNCPFHPRNVKRDGPPEFDT